MSEPNAHLRSGLEPKQSHEEAINAEEHQDKVDQRPEGSPPNRVIVYLKGWRLQILTLA